MSRGDSKEEEEMEKEVTLETWEDFESETNKIFESLKNLRKEKAPLYVSPPLFRGHESASWKLDSTLERFTTEQFTPQEYHRIMLATKPAVDSLTDRQYPLEEYEVPHDESFPRPPQGYEFMVYLRHHGFPSPLLDWTISPYVAAYFAFRSPKNTESENVAIYSYVEYLGGAKGGTVGAPAIYVAGPYVRTHSRHHIQQCTYTTCKKMSDDRFIYCNHEESFILNNQGQDRLTKFILPKTERQKVLEKLNFMNINAFSLFGNEEGLMEYLAFKEIKKK